MTQTAIVPEANAERAAGQVYRAHELGLGDAVRFATDAGAAYADMTVVQKTSVSVHLFRPYVHTSDFSYTGGVIPYIGTERFEASLDASFLLLRKAESPR